MKKLKSRQAKKHPRSHVSFHQRRKDKWRIADHQSEVHLSLRAPLFHLHPVIPESRCPTSPVQNSIRVLWPLHGAAVLTIVPPFQCQRIGSLFALCHSARFPDCWLSHSFIPFDLFSTTQGPVLRPAGNKEWHRVQPCPYWVFYKGVRQTLSYVINTLLQPLFFIIWSL